MNFTSKQIYNSFMQGAHRVIEKKEFLNQINVFPVQDGDTGSNLASMMRAILSHAESKETVKQTLESVANAAFYGARGNSGIIFAQYLVGLSEEIGEGTDISLEQYVFASNQAVKYAYEALENPVEGTIITVMKEWGKALSKESKKKNSMIEVFGNAFSCLEKALEKTKEQLMVLKKANVVDSGAQGFTFFVEGVLYYMKNGSSMELQNQFVSEQENKIELHEIPHIYTVGGYRYCTECLIEGSNINKEAIRNNLNQLGDSLVIAGNSKKCRIHIHTNEPAEVFRYLYIEGNIMFQKVEDIFKQESVVNHRKANIALLTDSIADLPKEIIDEEQIHMIYLDILHKDIVYMDKMTIEPERILEMIADDKKLPTSSQPNSKQLENTMDYLSTYYESVIVITVSKALSGTYDGFHKLAKKNNREGFQIRVINSKQNSGAEGLLVKKCGEYIAAGLELDEIVSKIEGIKEQAKILVQVRNIDSMIKGGRLSTRAGKIAKILGLKPIVTLDQDGKGALDSISFSIKGSNKKIIRHIKKILKTRTIEEYNMVHVNNQKGAEDLANIMHKIIGFEPAYIMKTSSIVAISAGEGAVAISYLLKREGE